ncbi:MAG TPA: hypothetical protein VG267_11980 [Terracidiphilus sp.]|jgi:hypothetical protein|nr:hypothetical protein [Terracidiphilus sp.]
MTAIEAALSGLIDYAGLYPPAALDVPAAVRNYLDYQAGARASMLGRFIVDIARIAELRGAAGPAVSGMQLSIIAPPTLEPAQLAEHSDLRIESLEIKSADPADVERLRAQLPSNLDCYFELPLDAVPAQTIQALARTGARGKLRMGGVAPGNIPSAASVIDLLTALAHHRVPFKATAGLHHPIRSCHRLTYAADSPTSTMHGFANLLCAAAILCFSGSPDDAAAVLQEENPHAFRIAPFAVGWRTLEWSADQLREVRRRFFVSFGSCSFTEPIQDLEALGWL